MMTGRGHAEGGPSIMLRGLSPQSGFAAGGDWALARLAPLAAIQLAALAILLWSETDWDARAAFLFTWGFLNFFWLALLRRPSVAGALSLALIVTLIALSQFKHGVLMMTATFVDVMLIDLGTLSFLMTIIPGLAWKVAVALVLVICLLVLLWQVDPFRIRRSLALAGCVCCFIALAALSFALPLDREDEFALHQYVSKFARSGAVAAVDLLTRGVLEADPSTPDRLQPAEVAACDTRRTPPHIIMVFDESSFDATMMPNVVVPREYQDRFRSADGKMRSLVVEGAGGPSWYTEYNVLTGLSVRSYGRFAESATRLAAGHVKRGLPQALQKCGYSTYSLYSWFGAFVGARSFQTTAGIEHFLDARQLGSGPADTDSFYYDEALRVIDRERERGPVFVFVYLAMNHFPWTYRYRPDLLSDWANPGNPYEIDEYLRRQEISGRDYTQFKQQLAREFPLQHFLLVRFGDHQPLFAKRFLEPGLDASKVAQRIAQHDPRYFTTYYALDGVNFQPVDLSSALATLDAPHLPLVVLEAAGLPLDAAFAEQKRILKRCHGLFYFCADGAEARRFNRLLINAGLIQGL
jgi:phosphoglycerol transferase MdoB-like AlkP superfamily enzyme